MIPNNIEIREGMLVRIADVDDPKLSPRPIRTVVKYGGNYNMWVLFGRSAEKPYTRLRMHFYEEEVRKMYEVVYANETPEK